MKDHRYKHLQQITHSQQGPYLTWQVCNPISKTILSKLPYTLLFLCFILHVLENQIKTHNFLFYELYSSFKFLIRSCFKATCICFPFSNRPPISVIYTIIRHLIFIKIRLNKLQLKVSVLQIFILQMNVQHDCMNVSFYFN